MANPTAEFRNDIGPLLDEAFALVEATKDVPEHNVQELRKRLAGALATAKEAYERVRDKTLEGTKYVDEYVHQNPYRVIGASFGIGVVIALFLARRD